MKINVYPKLAWTGIRKNKQLYLPYILTGIGMVMMFYIIAFLSVSDYVSGMRGGSTITTILSLGIFVIAVFAMIFLFYTNSFLIRRRKKEFGLYNILGMSKGNIARILFWEFLMVTSLSLGAGLFLGILFSKLAELCLMNILQGEITFSLRISPRSITITLLLFGIIFFLIFLNTLRQVQFSNPLTLLHSENSGEKPPRNNWILGLLGLLLLGGAYYLAVTIEDPLAAIFIFFVAVLMVIIGTYLLFIAGSVLFCRLLQRNKGYYYRPNHFVSLSSMVYRMKRNGAGLASICILATMVLVMISSTTCLFFGADNSLKERYPRNIMATVRLASPEDTQAENTLVLQETVKKVLMEKHTEPANILTYRTAVLDSYIEDGLLNYLQSPIDLSFPSLFFFIPLEDYNRIMGASESLEKDQVLIYSNRTAYPWDIFSLTSEHSFRVKKTLSEFFSNGDAAMSLVPSYFIVLPHFDEDIAPLTGLANYTGDSLLRYRWVYGFDTEASLEEQEQLLSAFSQAFSELPSSTQSSLINYNLDCRQSEYFDFYGIYGGLFFLGILLSLVFICSAVLIIYYKQISEGYEDQNRFEIMQKVGMTKREIRRSINSQLLTVFFLPLLMAGLHLTFAFPIIRRLLLLFGILNTPLLIFTTVVSFLIFALFYGLVYRITSNSYYHIVS